MVGRDPRDLMVSMEHHWNNMDLGRVLALRDQAVGNDDLDTLPQRPIISDDPTERFRAFVRDREYTGAVNLTVVMHHLDTGWQRRHDRNVIMCHYADYTADLSGELLRQGRALGFDLTIERARELAREASLDRMRARAGEVAPNAGAIWRGDRAFFRAGGFGEWRNRVTGDDLNDYDTTVKAIASPELASWAHAGRLASAIEPATT